MVGRTIVDAAVLRASIPKQQQGSYVAQLYLQSEWLRRKLAVRIGREKDRLRRKRLIRLYNAANRRTARRERVLR